MWRSFICCGEEVLGGLGESGLGEILSYGWVMELSHRNGLPRTWRMWRTREGAMSHSISMCLRSPVPSDIYKKGEKSTNRLLNSRDTAQDTRQQLEKQKQRVSTQESSNLLNTSPIPPHCLGHPRPMLLNIQHYFLRMKKPTIRLLIHKL